MQPPKGGKTRIQESVQRTSDPEHVYGLTQAEKRGAPKFTGATIDGASLSEGVCVVLGNRSDCERPVPRSFVCSARRMFLPAPSGPQGACPVLPTASLSIEGAL